MKELEAFLKKSKKLRDAATPRPWTTDYDWDKCLIDFRGVRVALTNEREHVSFDCNEDTSIANAAFIAHARNTDEAKDEIIRCLMNSVMRTEKIIAALAVSVDDKFGGELNTLYTDSKSCLARVTALARTAMKEGAE